MGTAGDKPRHPLSPLLFVLAADFLQSILNKAMNSGVMTPLYPEVQIQIFL
jgi:hypothetical protein